MWRNVLAAIAVVAVIIFMVALLSWDFLRPVWAAITMPFSSQP